VRVSQNSNRIFSDIVTDLALTGDFRRPPISRY